jgi:predicted nucleic acid-binding protein
MKALLDTNIVIHRETAKVVEQDIGLLYRWLDKGKYTKVLHPITFEEIEKFGNAEVVRSFLAKMESYERIKLSSRMDPQVQELSDKTDKDENDRNDSHLLNEVFVGRVDILITQDRKMHRKAAEMGISDRVFNINSFLEKVVTENPTLVDYRVLNVKKKRFGELDINDPFFESFKIDYPGFKKWFIQKTDEYAYVSMNTEANRVLSFLYLKSEDQSESYADITPPFESRKRLKIGTFKVISNGFRLGERFLKIIFDNALERKVDEIYVTIFDRTDEQKQLIQLLEQWGFYQHGQKGKELVFIRPFNRMVNYGNLRYSFPFVGLKGQPLLVAIKPEYHTELLPDSILRTESSADYTEGVSHRNAINKVFVSRAIEKNVKSGDILIFYRTGGLHRSVITTIGLVEEVVDKFEDKQDFIRQCLKRSVYSEEKLSEIWDYNRTAPFIVRFLYVYSFPKRINMATLINHGILSGVDDAPRGFKPISKEQFRTILKLTESDESFIID